MGPCARMDAPSDTRLERPKMGINDRCVHVAWQAPYARSTICGRWESDSHRTTSVPRRLPFLIADNGQWLADTVSRMRASTPYAEGMNHDSHDIT